MQDKPITSLRGIGAARAEAFAKLGVKTVGDLLYLLPRSFQDFSKERLAAELSHGELAAVRVRIVSEPKLARFRGHSVVTARATDGVSNVLLKWYGQPYRRSQVCAGQTVIAAGRIDRARGLTIQNPQLLDALPGLVPVYPLCRGLTQRIVRDAMRQALEAEQGKIDETLPEQIRIRYELMPLDETLRNVHFPLDQQSIAAARRRLEFENALSYLVVAEMQRLDRKRSVGVAFVTDGVRERYMAKLPFTLTKAQLRVLGELGRDMASPVPMNRLIQGDVGSGKTAVAMYALCVAAANGYQGVLLAPTEILAQQHYDTLHALFGASVCLVTGHMKKTSRDAALSKIADGTALVAVGTHALLSQNVRFARLGLVVTDEQHRFGVTQRAVLEKKGTRPDVLVMSATPIPRTLAILLYGDLDISVLDEVPPGRKPVKTSCIPQRRRRDMYDYVARQAALGFQTYVVCPFIEPSEGAEGPSVTELLQELTKDYPQVAFGLLHGRMQEKEKNAAIEAFREGKTRVLVTTTVIEVGVHVEKATTMIIEGADRFGLAQLHQLRGRVGRGSVQSYCFLVPGSSGDMALKRLAALTETNDGFLIAERDLEQRGAGDLFGTRQHGDGDAEQLSMAGNVALLQEAKTAAEDIMTVPNAENNAFLDKALRRYAAVFDSITMN